MAQEKDIVVIGGSAGALSALTKIAAGLTLDLHAAVFVVLHVPPTESNLPEILSRSGPLPAYHAADGEDIRPGRIYIAPPDRHLLLEDKRVRVTREAKENRHRPSINRLFRSAAAYGNRVVSVLLSGALNDGVEGLAVIKAAHGTIVVQDPETAMVKSMPRYAIEEVDVDYVEPAERLPTLLNALVRGETPPSAHRAAEHASDPEEPQAEAQGDGGGSTYSCPECGGVLHEHKSKTKGELGHFACQVGHMYSPETFLVAQAEALEGALWVALRTLEERANLSAKFARDAARRGHAAAHELFKQREARAREHAAVVRNVIRTGAADRSEPKER
jgi:two-component system, chemotaxis family, protein-glutamate methylesterase/glutaminase